MVANGFTTVGKTLPFSIDEEIWDILSADIRRVLWDGWSLKLQLDDISASKSIEERERTGLIKPLVPLTPEQSQRRRLKLDAKMARLDDVKRAAAERIALLQRNLAV